MHLRTLNVTEKKNNRPDCGFTGNSSLCQSPSRSQLLLALLLSGTAQEGAKPWPANHGRVRISLTYQHLLWGWGEVCGDIISLLNWKPQEFKWPRGWQNTPSNRPVAVHCLSDMWPSLMPFKSRQQEGSSARDLYLYPTSSKYSQVAQAMIMMIMMNFNNNQTSTKLLIHHDPKYEMSPQYSFTFNDLNWNPFALYHMSQCCHSPKSDNNNKGKLRYAYIVFGSLPC